MTSTFLRSVELTTPGTFTHSTRLFRTLILFVCFIAAMIAVEPVSAQTPAMPSSCFPSCSDVDARFLSIAGTNLSTLSNSEVVMKIGSPASASTVEIGIFDGETGGMWDYGTTSLTYTLFADPTGTATGTTQIAVWTGADMIDNAWKTFTVTNPVSAQSPGGNYLYHLVIASSDPLASYMSNFKIRTDGTVALKAQAFTVSAAALKVADLNVIYPAGWSNVTPSTPTTYDGTFNFFLDVKTKGSTLSIWDGDMDFGSYDCSVRDVDDINTSNFVLPPWATPLTANLEGIGFGDPCSIGIGFTTGTPPDDYHNAKFRRSPSVIYDVISPQGAIYPNGNPSGSREWEEFRIATGPVNTLLNDAAADSLPAGIYNVSVRGMDIANLNGWRFFFDALGVDGGGDPTPPLLPYSIAGTVYYVPGAVATTSEPIANATVTLVGDLNGDNVNDLTRTTTTNENGEYSFAGVVAGSYRVTVATSTIPADAVPDNDFDGVATPNTAAVVITSASNNPDAVFFAYDVKEVDGTGGVRSHGYWKTHEKNWPVSTITIGCKSYAKADAINIMKTAVKTDKTYNMFYELTAAKLNVLSGAKSSCINSVIIAAESWLCTNKLGTGVTSSSNAWQNSGSELHTALEAYNTGHSCAPHVK